MESIFYFLFNPLTSSGRGRVAELCSGRPAGGGQDVLASSSESCHGSVGPMVKTKHVEKADNSFDLQHRRLLWLPWRPTGGPCCCGRVQRGRRCCGTDVCSSVRPRSSSQNHLVTYSHRHEQAEQRERTVQAWRDVHWAEELFLVWLVDFCLLAGEWQ